MKIDIDLSEEQLFETLREDYRDDVDFLFKAIDKCTSTYGPIITLIERLYDPLPEEHKHFVLNLLNAEQ